MNKNTIFAWASFILFIIGSSLVLLGVFKYPEYLVELTLAGLGFITIGLRATSTVEPDKEVLQYRPRHNR